MGRTDRADLHTIVLPLIDVNYDPGIAESRVNGSPEDG
ncbi:hypothetical protein ABIA39_001890 [Nocardia sp. GAS34]